jgi:hypothetical protein
MKQYLRDLPDPLLTFNLYDNFVIAIRDFSKSLHPHIGTALEPVKTLLAGLPTDNFVNLQYLIKASATVRQTMLRHNITN